MQNNQSIFLNKNLSFRFNPFGGITTEELNRIIIPKSFSGKIIQLIKSPEPAIIELVGKQGRGKTTHLTYLHQSCPQYPIIYFTKKNNTITNSIFNEKVIFLDSIHHLSFQQRIKIFQNFEKVILTTHHTRILEYKWARRKHKSFFFKGLKKEDLQHTIERRIQSALKNQSNKKIKINEKYLNQLIQNYNDDFRGILNHLYETLNK